MDFRRSLPVGAALVGCLAFLFPLPSASAGLSEATDYEGEWTSGADSNYVSWNEQSGVSLDGKDAALGTLPGSMDSWMETTIQGPTTLYFSYRVVDFRSSYWQLEPESRGFFFKAAGLIRRISSVSRFGDDSGWQEMAVPLPAGLQVVRWELTNPGDSSPVLAYVDQVWTSSDSRPRITHAPTQSGTFGMVYSWNVPITSEATTLIATGLPPGLSAHSETHVISGTPTAAGTFEATLTAVNASGQHVVRVSFDIAPALVGIPEAVDAPALKFTQLAGGTGWAGGAGLGHDGLDCAIATQRGGNAAYLATEVAGPGTLSFWYRTESAHVKGGVSTTYLNFYMGKPVSVPPATEPLYELDWTKVTVPVPAGVQLISWAANRTYAGSVIPPGALHCYLDEVEFVPSQVPSQSIYSEWLVAWNVADLPAATDTDGDGLNLIMEYATGGSPHEPNPELAPTFSVVDGHFTIHFTKGSSPSDLLYFVQGSRALAPNAWTTSSVEVMDEDGTHLVARCKKPVSEEPLFYLRVRVLVAQ